MISVVMPIGPSRRAGDYFEEALRSLMVQTLQPASLVIVDDMSYGRESRLGSVPFHVDVITNRWRLGIPNSFNVGVASARTECVLMMGADDTLEPTCLEECWQAYEESTHKSNTYFWLGVRYSDGREDQYLPCNAAMVTKSLWINTGGFPIESASGACDAAFINIILTHPHLFGFHCVNPMRPLYNYRVHDLTDTSLRDRRWQPIILETRSLVSELWTPPEWGRYE
jgi:Glycosyltransferases involved in cell wall biogenesis